MSNQQQPRNESQKRVDLSNEIHQFVPWHGDGTTHKWPELLDDAEALSEYSERRRAVEAQSRSAWESEATQRGGAKKAKKAKKVKRKAK